MKWAELENKNTNELEELLAEKRSDLFNLRFQISGAQLKQVSKIKEVRKTIAKLKAMLANRAKEDTKK